MFFRPAKPVLDSVTALRNRDPCGDTNSIIPALLQQQAQLPRIREPVLIVCGNRDALYAPLGCRGQGERFTRSRSVSVRTVRNIGHAITLEPPARTFRRTVSRWLARRNF
jgi:pimeloyl-ACP methyl ester carboxylesterase